MTSLCVFAGSNVGFHAAYKTAAQALGRTLAERRIKVVYGGGKVGLMGALADAALDAHGHVTGVIPSALVTKEIAHASLSDLRIVASMHERKALMTELSDGFIALPGGLGTLEELFEVLTWAQLGFHAKPCGLLNVQGYFDGLLSFIDHAVGEGFLRQEYRSMILASESPDHLLDRLATHTPPRVEKWIDRDQT